MQAWAGSELKYADLGDARLNRRLIKIVENLAAQPQASITQASASWAETKATYAFWRSERIEAAAIIEAHQRSATQRAKEHEMILAIQDTTDLNFTHHKSKTPAQGFGAISAQEYLLGLKVHSVFGVTTQGVPLGVLHHQVWSRDPKHKGKAKKRRTRPLKDKESKRWLSSLVATELAVPETTTVVTVADCEADIYELLALERAANSHLLIRAAHNRRVDHESQYLQQAIAQADPCGQLLVEIPAKDERPARTATVTIRLARLTIEPPRHSRQRSQRQPIAVNVVWANEENPPAGIKPISWLLLTTLTVDDFEDAVGCVRWYSYRWLIERYHYVLKSGCRLEQLQLETAERLEKALATYAIVAWRLLWLTYHSRVNGQLPCDTVLDADEWQSLYCQIHRCSIPACHPPSLRQAVRWIAQLGGFLARKHDGEPGVKTIWRGLQRLHDIASTWKLVRSDSPESLCFSTYG
jgi:IS4 transposase